MDRTFSRRSGAAVLIQLHEA